MVERRPAADRLHNEITHHRNLAAKRTEEIWGWDSPAGRRRADRRAQLFLARGRIGAETRILELGCGTGEFTRRLARARPALTALDLSEELLAKARVKVPTGVGFVLGNAESLPFPNSAFEVVYGCSVLHHLEVTTALGEVRRVLRPGGRLVFSEPNLLNPQVFVMFKCDSLKSYFGTSPDEMAFTRGMICRTLRQLGFERIRVDYFDFLHPSTPTLLISAAERLTTFCERVPLLRAIAGSLLIYAERR